MGDCKTKEQQIGNQTGDCDFEYDPTMFGNHTFVDAGGKQVTTKGPVQLLKHFKDDLSMRFGGIRKPRSYSNVELSNSSGWLLPDKDSVGAGGNNWNYSVPSFRNWYTDHSLHFLRDGISYCE